MLKLIIKLIKIALKHVGNDSEMLFNELEMLCLGF